jgi:SAM-dependent methyltransferase
MNKWLISSHRARLAVGVFGDAWDRLLGRHDPLVPPRRYMSFVGAGDFRRMGEEFTYYFIELAGLKPDDDVLDIGSGVGRMAVPLLDYLTGRYEGFDIVPLGVKWCRKHISARYPNFRFTLADVENGLYRPKGRYKACEYRFPYDDASFDFAFAISVFTHLLPEDAANYVNEAGRTLRDGKTFFATFFVLDEEPAEGNATLDFRVAGDRYRSTSADVPEAAVAYTRHELEAMLAAAGLTLISYFPGSWSGRPDNTTFQDIVIARKDAPR